MGTVSGAKEKLRWRPWPCASCHQGFTAISYLVERAGAGGTVPANSFENIVREQIGWLSNWLDQCPHGGWISAELPRLDEGSEHLVCVESESASVVKQTRLRIYGESYYLDNRGVVCQQNCTPLEYLSRLQLWDEAFAGAPVALGMTADGRIVSRQAFIAGLLPTQEQVDAFLVGANLVPVRQDRWLWKLTSVDERYEVWIGDARRDNFVLTPEGVIPIDLRLWKVPRT